MPSFPSGFSDLASVTASTKFLGDSGSANGLGSASQIKDYLVGAGMPIVLGHSPGSASHTGNTSETTKGTLTIPGGTMGANGKLRITSLWEIANNANTKTLRVRFGGIGGAVFGGITLTSGYVAYEEQKYIVNDNSASAQKAWPVGGNGGFGVVNSAIILGTVNTAVDQDLVFTIQNANSGDTSYLHHWIVELIK